jgi:hypothetical protein
LGSSAGGSSSFADLPLPRATAGVGGTFFSEAVNT